MRWSWHARYCAIGLLVPACGQAQQAAQNIDDAGAAQLPALIVTADKVPRSLEQVASSVAVIDGLEIEQSGIAGLEQLEGRLPGLSFQPFGQAGMNAPVVRGLTANFNSFSTSTLLLVDGVPTLSTQGFEHSMLDVDRIELLRGPQSTLYGRNAEAGVLAIHSLPMDNQMRNTAALGLGSRNQRTAQFAVSRPLVADQWYASIAGSWRQQDGFVRNTASGRDEDGREQQNLRLGLRWTPAAGTDLVLRYNRSRHDDGAMLWGAPTSPRAQVASGSPGWNRSWGQSGSLQLAQQLGGGMQLHAVTAWNDVRDRIQQDTDFQPLDRLRIGRDNQLRTLSQELRLEGTSGAAQWLLGLYADRSDNDLQTTNNTWAGEAQLQARQKGSTAAVFSHWSLPLSADWTLSAGARVERLALRFRPSDQAQQKKEWTLVSPKLALQYQFAPQQQWYASISRGVRTGGFNVMAPAQNYLAYEPEKLWSYETGVKGTLADRRLRYSLAAYAMDVSSMQVMQMPAPGTMYITSAAAATSKGLELELDYLLSRQWQLQAGLAWNHIRFDRFIDGAANYRGKRNPFAPDWSGHVGVRYQTAQGWYGQAGVRGSSKVYLDAANRYTRNGFGLIDLVAGYRRAHWDLSLYVNNAANQRYDAVGYQNGFVTVFSPPRKVGLRWVARM